MPVCLNFNIRNLGYSKSSHLAGADTVLFRYTAEIYGVSTNLFPFAVCLCNADILPCNVTESGVATPRTR